MIKNIFGVPSHLIVRWILKSGGKVGPWVDLGCGKGEYLRSIGITPHWGIGIDAAQAVYNLPQYFYYIQKDFRKWLDYSIGEKYDLISMFDVAEHFPKEEALGLIDKAKNLADRIVIATPSGFLKQDGETHPKEKDNPFQWHKCGFSPREFEELGFLVFVLKNYHRKAVGNNGKSFDRIIAYRNLEMERKIGRAKEETYFQLAKKIKTRSMIYNLNPLNFLRTAKSFL